MNENIKHYLQSLGYLTTLHANCRIIDNSGGKLYECSCCNKTFRGGINGAIEWNENMGKYEEYEELENYKLCMQEKIPFKWYLKQIRIIHHKYVHSWKYDKKMNLLLTACCHAFGLQANKKEFEKLKDVAIRQTKCVPYDIQKMIDDDQG